MGFDISLWRNTETSYNHETRTSTHERQELWWGRGYELGETFLPLLGEETKREVSLEDLETFVVNYKSKNEYLLDQVNDLKDVLSKTSDTEEYSLDDTFFELEISY